VDDETLNTKQQLLPSFGSHFLDDHARSIISDSKIALVELIANCWDAGANRVDITWPNDSVPDPIEIKDDGTGMTYAEFTQRWLQLNYNRREIQGDDVIFPDDNKKSLRKAYGTNGKGRHSMFCFTNRYSVETWKNGTCNIFLVNRSESAGNTPFAITPKKKFSKEGHGTIISAELGKNYLEIPLVRDLIGSKFVTDPGFLVYLNGDLVELTKLEHLIDNKRIHVKNIGDIIIHCVDSQKIGRTSKQHGVAWWVNKRLVGEPSWREIDEIAYLDARTREAHRYTFIIEADILSDEVKEDWSDFKDTEKVKTVKVEAKEQVLAMLQDLMKDVHKSRKIALVTSNRKEFSSLSKESQYQVGRFVDEIQTRVPVLDNKVLNATVEVLLKLEKSRSGFALLDQLSKLNPNDIDALNQILEQWTVQEARIVLDELRRRIKLIESLEQLVENPSSDELHELQPLFEKGLWIFGPEYESIQFMSNRSLATVLRKLIGDKEIKSKIPKNRPDFIALSDSSIGLYSQSSFDERGEVKGLGKILIIELKRGGFKISRKEMLQALDYANEIIKSGKCQTNTIITAFVLGTTIETDAKQQLKEGDQTIVQSETYSTTLQRAHARTFNLLKKIEKAKEFELYDEEIEEVLSSPEKLELFPL
jgi:Histidine kinase-, DNA gyrase B-, and HSP90-like ATPase